MGGRVGMCYAAKYPEDVSALVVEDMDIRRRSVDSNFIPNFDATKAISFERRHDSLESVRKAVREIGYPPDMVEKWISEGRIYQQDEVSEEGGKGQYFWSEVNPAFRALCYETIFDSDSGTESWNTIARHLKNGASNMSLHLKVAGIGTVCNEACIEEMQKVIEGDRLVVKTYPEGTHSIHNSAREEFMSDLERIIEDSAKQSAKL